jgi:flagellar basal-body rod modification protein FlgD
MTSPVGSIGTTNGVDKPTAATTTTKTTTNTDDKDMFLKLLIAQMKYQDPSNPTDPSQYMSQMAQFTQVEKLEDVANSQASALTTSQMATAVSMVGSKVEFGAGDDAASGTVNAVTVIDGVPQLLVGTQKVALTDVTKVTAA